MKRITILLIFGLILISCNKKDVKIPVIALNGAEEIANNSQIWMFYTEKNGESSMKVNEKNRISTTHWLFNIDKRLLLKDVLPKTKKLLIKHSSKSPHSDGTMKNYYSYVNSLNEKWSFYQFDSIQYQFTKANLLPNFTQESDTILIKYYNGTSDDKALSNTKSIIQTAFSDTMSFQEYMTVKSKLDAKFETTQVSFKEYIFSE